MFVAGITGGSKGLNIGEHVAKDLINLKSITCHKKLDLCLLLDSSLPAQKARDYAPSLGIRFVDYGKIDAKNVEDFVAKSNVILVFGTSVESELFQILTEYAGDEDKVKLRGRQRVSIEPHRFNLGDPYAQYHEMVTLHTHHKRIPFQGVRVLREVDLRPPAWTGGIKRLIGK